MALEDKVNEILGLESKTPPKEEFKAPVPRKEDKSKEDVEKNSVIWNDFNKRFIELINERFNTDSMRVKRLLNQTENDEIVIKYLLTLSLCISNKGFQKLKQFLFDF